MLYEIPMHTGNRPPLWERGIGSIPVRLTDGTAAGLPVLAGANVLTVGRHGDREDPAPTPSPRQDRSCPRIRGCGGVFFETKRTFLDAFLRPEDKVITYASSAVPSGNLFRWCLIREIRQARDREAEMRQIAEALFSGLLADAEKQPGLDRVPRGTPLSPSSARSWTAALTTPPTGPLIKCAAHHNGQRSAGLSVQASAQPLPAEQGLQLRCQ